MTTLDTIQLDQLDARIRSVWVREQKLHLISGLLAALRWLVPLFLGCMVIDWLTYMPAIGRVVMLLLIVGLSLQRAWAMGWKQVRPFNAIGTALKLEKHHGQLDSLLVSAIQLRSDPASGGGSDALRDHTCRLAEQAASSLRPEQAVPYQPLRNPGLFAVLAVGVIAVFAAVNTPFLSAGVVRIFAPWVAVEYPTNTQITLEQKELVVKEGDSAEIQALIGGVVPEQATIYVKTGQGRARAIDLDITDGATTYNIASASRDFTYRIKAGDDRTAWHNVRVVPSPRLEEVNVQLAYPEYLQRKNDTVQALTLTVPEGTSIGWQLKLDRPISAAQFIPAGQDPVDLEVGSDGLSVTFTEEVAASQGYNFLWVEKDNGYRFTSPRYFLQVASDQPPRVELTSPAGNLVAMAGRPLELAVRAQDDHGLGSTSIVYRVNQLNDQVVKLDQPVASGQGEQTLDWDYRQAIKDLKIGDTISFTIEVSDRYPGPEGAHIVRSETRRLTLLSKEQYLEQIKKQMDRLLSRVQSIYRQQRSAHEVVRSLSPQAEGYMQACQLEAIRQEMVRDQLKEIATGLQDLLDDLAANGVSDALQAKSVEAVRLALIDIAENHIARAASELRAQFGGLQDKSIPASRNLSADAVNAASRELGRIVMLRGIDAAQEVFAREARMLAQAQATLRWYTAANPSADVVADLVKQHDELAQWTEQLIADLQSGMSYDKRPLAILRLTRSVKDLKNQGISSNMRQAGDLVRAGQTEQAMTLQLGLMKSLLNADFSVRLSGAYSTLLRTRDQMRVMTQSQLGLHENIAGLSDEAFEVQQSKITAMQTDLRRQLLTLMLPTIPAPRSSLLDEGLSPVPPMAELLAKADKAMVQALSAIASGDKALAVTQQKIAEQTLGALTVIVDVYSVEMGLQTQGLGTVVAAASDRMSRIEEFEARVIALLEQTDIAASEEKKIDNLAEPQFILSEELADFHKELDQLNKAEPDADLPPLLSKLVLAELALNAGVEALKKNDVDGAIVSQEESADALAEAMAIGVAQHERLSFLQSLLLFQRSVSFANGYMADIVDEQRDLLRETENSEQADVPGMLPKFQNMRNCMEDVAPLLDLVAARLDVGTPLAFAKTDFEDAILSLEAGDKLDAVDAQDVAAESLAEVQKRVAAIKTQTGFVAEMVQFLHAMTSDVTLMQHEQTQLLAKTQATDKAGLKALADVQDELARRAEQMDRLIQTAAGSPKIVLPPDPLAGITEPGGPVPVFNPAAESMRSAANALAQENASDAAAHMQAAADALAGNAESLFVVITMVNGLPSIEVSNQTEPEIARLIDVLALASEQRHLSRKTTTGGKDALPAVAQPQRKLAESCGTIAANGEVHPMLAAAHKHLTDALAAQASGDWNVTARSQQAADTQLRHFIVEQSIILDTAIPPPAPSDGDGDSTEGSDSESAVTAGFISDFVSGETPEDKQTEWKVLADRNRAALNQNFARELPLEYRSLLKDYYERVAK